MNLILRHPGIGFNCVPPILQTDVQARLQRYFRWKYRKFWLAWWTYLWCSDGRISEFRSEHAMLIIVHSERTLQKREFYGYHF